ncbi:MAG: recombinase family protein [Verrucomicrobiales bacterium]|nr:recombinase family protein [Verrucomicrobiales bacterium]
MNPKITPEHLRRGAIVYVRQSTIGQVLEHTKSKRRQYALADSARDLGFESVSIIDDDLGRSGSGLVERPGFQKLVAAVCAGSVGSVLCIEASRLARNGGDWHHLIDLCALVDTLVIDHDGIYDPRLINDRLLLGLKGTMSEYELSLLRQRGLAARDAKARRGELRFALPPGYCWDELGRIEIDPDERVAEAIRLIFRKFQELGSARQVFIWAREVGMKLPVLRQNPTRSGIEWREPAYHTINQVLKHPMYAGAYVFGRTAQRTQVVDGRARKSMGHHKPMDEWNVLIRDHHPGYIAWKQFEANQTLLTENAHMQKRTIRKSGRGGRALLAGLVRCGRCGRMMRVFYGMRSGHSHRYQCFGDVQGEYKGVCVGVGGVRVDRAVATQILEAVAPHAVEAAMRALEQVARADADMRKSLERELEQARYEAALAARRHAAVDPDKRLVARELEARWNVALGHVAEVESRIAQVDAAATARPPIDRAGLLALAHDLPSAWNAPGTQDRTKQRLTRILIHEVVLDQKDDANEVVLTIHWTGGRHTEVRVSRIRSSRYPEDRHPSPVEVIRCLGGQWPDRQLAVTMNRMRCRSATSGTWTTVRVRELRERLGIPPFDPTQPCEKTISVDETARRLKVCVGSVLRLIREGVLPAKQLMPVAPWQVPVAALNTEPVQIGVRAIVERRPRNFTVLQDEMTLKLPGLL